MLVLPSLQITDSYQKAQLGSLNICVLAIKPTVKTK